MKYLYVLNKHRFRVIINEHFFYISVINYFFLENNYRFLEIVVLDFKRKLRHPFIVGILYILRMRDNHIGRGVLSLHPSTMALLHGEYLRLGAVRLANRSGD